MGGAIAQTLALTAPDNVAGLVLIGTGARLPVNPRILEGAQSEAAFPGTVAQIIHWAFAPNAPAQLTRLAQQRMLEVRPTVLHADFTACNTFDVAEAINQVVTPTLVLCGAADKMVPERASRFLAEQIAGATLKLIPDVGHMLMLEQPQVVAEAISGFVRRYWGEANG
ncbi:MAG: alpha/beta hydrolase [Chloroflexi bacterium]|nr:alpha/beta hydrolase [Chloroflexota bacterium]